MKRKFNKAFNIFEKTYCYTIAAIFAILIAFGLRDAIKEVFTAAPWFWIILGVGFTYIQVLGILMYVIHKHFSDNQKGD